MTASDFIQSRSFGDFNYDSEDQYLNVILKGITTISKISWVEFVDKTEPSPVIKDNNCYKDTEDIIFLT